MSTTFADLGVPVRLVEALAADGITQPFPVQAITLPDALAGKDLCGRAPTGSGKTLGFGIPMMVRISQAEPTKPTGLVLVPTRELAEQVQRAFVPLGRAQWRFIQAIYGGASFGPQIHSLRKGASVVVATPGRLLDIIEKGYCDLSAVEVCVVDEADRMADLGFMPDVRKILDMTPTTRQTMLWSATLDGDVNELIRDYMNNPVRHDLMDEEDAAPVDHKFVVTRPSDRLDAAVALIEEHGPTIVFVKTRFGVDDVSEDLNRAGVKAGALHGARSQAIRQRTLEDFKRGKIQALVATDVAARGIHVDNVSLVLHYDLPDNDKDYTHRSGRTGRAGNTGLVIAFVPPSRQRIAQRMSDSVNAGVTWEQGEKPIERVPAGERETGNRDRGERERSGGYAGRTGRGSYAGDRGSNDRGGDGGSRGSYAGDRGSNDRADRGGYGGQRDRNDAPRTDRYAGPRSGATAPGADRGSGTYRDRNAGAPRDRNDWTPRPRRDDDRTNPRGRTEWTPRPPRADDRGNDRNDWSPRPPRADGPPRDRNDWSPRPPRADDRGNDRSRFNRDDRPRPGGDDRRPGGYSSNADRGRSDRPSTARDGQQPPFGRDGHSDRPWRNRDDAPAASTDRARNQGDRENRGPSATREGRPDRPGFGGGYKGTAGGYKGVGGGYKGNAGGAGKPSGGFGGGYKGNTTKPGGSRSSAPRPGGGPERTGFKSGGFKTGGFRQAPGGDVRRRPEHD